MFSQNCRVWFFSLRYMSVLCPCKKFIRLVRDEIVDVVFRLNGEIFFSSRKMIKSTLWLRERTCFSNMLKPTLRNSNSCTWSYNDDAKGGVNKKGFVASFVHLNFIAMFLVAGLGHSKLYDNCFFKMSFYFMLDVLWQHLSRTGKDRGRGNGNRNGPEPGYCRYLAVLTDATCWLLQEI